MKEVKIDGKQCKAICVKTFKIFGYTMETADHDGYSSSKLGKINPLAADDGSGFISFCYSSKDEEIVSLF